MRQAFLDVLTFHQKLDLPIGWVPRQLDVRDFNRRLKHTHEELFELLEARVNDDLAGQADAIVDTIYVLIGTAVEMGLPLEQLWADVQRANLERVREDDGYGHKLGVKKPPGWQGPQTQLILELCAQQRGGDGENQALDNL